MPAPTAILRYDPTAHAAIADQLWAGADTPWQLDVGKLRRWADGFVATDESGQPIGFVALDPAGSIPFLVVAPAYRRRGIGRALLDEAAHALDQLGVTAITAGCGSTASVWPGVPSDLPAACRLLDQAGWRVDHQTFDLVQDLQSYSTPPGVLDAASAAGLRVAVEPISDDVLVFERAEFPNWLHYYQEPSAEALVGRDRDGTVVGATLLDGPDVSSPFTPMLETAAATIGCVGVAAARQGHGIGTLLVARGSEILRAHGARTCHISWTTRANFYRTLGYQDWRSYQMYRLP